jgi:hypothetical protein
VIAHDRLNEKYPILQLRALRRDGSSMLTEAWENSIRSELPFRLLSRD